MSEFSDKPFIAGTLRGLRAFDVSYSGTLSSIYFRYIWNANINSAACNIATKIKTICPHDNWMGCTCGFYAYTTGRNDLFKLCDPDNCYTTMSSHSRRIGAIIEGWGSVIVGDRGFRAEKARIVAIIFNPAHRFVLDYEYNGVPKFESQEEALRHFPLETVSQVENNVL